MPAGMSFSQLKPEEREPTLACARGERTTFAWEKTNASELPDHSRRAETIAAEVVVGGNLSRSGPPWSGRPYAGRRRWKDSVSRRCRWPPLPHRPDDRSSHAIQAGGLDGVRAIILGDFTNCDDESSTCLKHLPSGTDPRKLLDPENQRERIPLRKVFPIDTAALRDLHPHRKEAQHPDRDRSSARRSRAELFAAAPGRGL